MALSEEEKRQNKVQKTFERYKALTIGKIKNDVLKEFQMLRRYQEFGDSFFLPSNQVDCISCGYLIPDPRTCDAGHFISRKHTATAFHPDNVWPQCKSCNQHKNGNLAEYRKRLVEMIGWERVAILDVLKDVPVTFTKWQYAQLKEAYRSMVKREKERLGL